MSYSVPALGGPSGLSPRGAPLPFRVESGDPLDHRFRHLPASIRILAEGLVPELAERDEEEIYGVVRKLLEPGARTISRAHWEETWSFLWFMHWYREPAQNRLYRWWGSTKGWRAPQEFKGWHAIEDEWALPHVEPYEVANFRLPDDISCDEDVVLFQAWCQGVRDRDLGDRDPRHAACAESVRRGLVKFCRSPWVHFAIAAPSMFPIGVLFPPIGYLASCSRMDFLLKNPFSATTGELEAILGSQTFLVAREKMRKKRVRGDYIAPDGEWYVGGGIPKALGRHFRRGTEWTATKRGRK